MILTNCNVYIKSYSLSRKSYSIISTVPYKLVYWNPEHFLCISSHWIYMLYSSKYVRPIIKS